MPISFIHTADLHLGSTFQHASFPRRIAKERREEMWETFFNIIEVAKEKRVDFLLISGDLFDEQLVTTGQLKRVNEAFKSIAGTEVIISPGNHDYYGEKGLYQRILWSQNVHLFTSSKLCKFHFDALNTDVYGFAWTTRHMEETFPFDEMTLDKTKNNILMLHGDAYNKGSQYLPIDQEALSKTPFDYIALGHIHKADVLAKNMRYAGSPEPLDFGETGQHGVILGQVDAQKLHVQFLQVASREFVIEEMELHPEMSHEDIVHLLLKLEGREQNLYRVKLIGFVDPDLDIDGITQEAGRAFYYLEIIDETTPDYNLDKIYEENEGNIIGMYIKEMGKLDMSEHKNKDALYLGLEALLKENGSWT